MPAPVQSVGSSSSSASFCEMRIHAVRRSRARAASRTISMRCWRSTTAVTPMIAIAIMTSTRVNPPDRRLLVLKQLIRVLMLVVIRNHSRESIHFDSDDDVVGVDQVQDDVRGRPEGGQPDAGAPR